MSNQLWQRFGAACGILYVVLLIVGGSIVERSEESMTAEATVRAFAEAAARPITAVGFSLVILAFLCFLFFLGSLWSALRQTEGENAWLSAVAFGGGLISLTFRLAGAVSIYPVFRRANEGLDPQIAQTLLDMNDASFLTSFFPLAVLLLASAFVAIQYGALPRWLGWLGAVVAVALLGGAMAGGIYWVDWAGLPFLLFLLWTVITSIALIRRVGKPFPAVSSASVSLPPAVS